MTMMAAEEALKRRYQDAGQGHVFQYLDKLNDSERKGLFSQLDAIQVERLAPLLQSARDSSSSSDADAVIEPFSGAVAHSNDETLKQASEKGLEVISKGKVAALVLAGGQGTRLGSSAPKGCFDIGLPSRRSLFQLLAERIQKLQQLSNGTVPFYIMTSPLNHDETVSYFKCKDYFGLDSNKVYFFQQGMLPCLTTNEGKIIMESAGKVAMAPDGNGGIYPSLASSGALHDMEKRGVKYLHVFSIDNALVKPADPLFMSYCIEQEADCGNKVVWKAHAHEKVGVVATRGGKPCIVEYSEITTEMAEQTEANDRLVYGAANICNHFYTLDFIRDTILPNMGNLYHIANKKIPFYDETKQKTVTPTANNGIKLETFIFDVFPLSKRMAVLDVQRTEEFSPVKNKDGSDSPATAREMISCLAKKWVIEAGGTLTGDEKAICEISPLTSYAGEGLEELVQGKEIACPFSL